MPRVAAIVMMFLPAALVAAQASGNWQLAKPPSSQAAPAVWADSPVPSRLIERNLICPPPVAPSE